MTSCSSSSDDETFKKQIDLSQSTITPLAGLTTEEGLHYLNKKYTERFTAEDALFTEALARPTIPPPIVLNFNGKQPIQPRRRGGYHNKY